MAAPTTSDFLNQTTPAAPSGDQNVVFQTDGGTPSQQITAYPKRATASLFGTVKPDGTSITISGGVISASGGGGGGFAGDILSPDKATGTLNYQKNEYATCTNGSTLNLLNYSGGSPGYVDWFTLQTFGADPSACTINVYYNGSGTPTISCPYANFFMAQYVPGSNGAFALSHIFGGLNKSNASSRVSVIFKLPIPFTSGIKIDLVNNSGSTLTVWSNCEYQTGVANTWSYTRVLHVDAYYATGLAANSVNTLVNYTGGAMGRFVGLWFLDDGFPGTISPYGAPLEGNIKLYLDGSSTPNAQSSGTEDWFGLGFYFAGNNTGGVGGGSGNSSELQAGWTCSGGEIGMTFAGGVAAETNGAFRFHVRDKRYFNSGLKITWNCGDTTEINFTGTDTVWSTAFYYTES
jgi:hypothetical protein